MKKREELRLSTNGPLGWPPKRPDETGRWGEKSEFENLNIIKKLKKTEDTSQISYTPSTNWSGFVASRQNKDVTITQVEACWTVPRVERSPNNGAWHTCSCWIGIGGAGIPGRDESKNILQVGTDSDVQTVAGGPADWYGAWYQWVPGPTWVLDRQIFPVLPGDTIDAVIVMHKGSKTEATVYLHNQTQGNAMSFDVPNPTKVEITGNCAEWIVEKVYFEDDKPALAYFGAVYFDEARAFTDGGEEIGLKEGDRGTLYHIIQKGEHYSQSTLLGDHVVRCVYVGPGSGGRKAIKNEFFSPNDAADLKKVAAALNKNKSGKLGPIRDIVKRIQVRHYRTPCSAGFP